MTPYRTIATRSPGASGWDALPGADPHPDVAPALAIAGHFDVRIVAVGAREEMRVREV